MNLKLISAAALAGVLLLGGSARALAGQSLADVARREAARRKTIKTPSKVFTDKDLRAVPPPPTSEASGAEASPSGDAATGAPAAPSEGKPRDSGPAKDQAYWAKRMKDLQAKLGRDQAFSDALQTRINVLTADFTSHDNPVERAAIGENRQRALDQFNSLQKDLADDKKAISDLQEEARRAGVPPGWLRS